MKYFQSRNKLSKTSGFFSSLWNERIHTHIVLLGIFFACIASSNARSIFPSKEWVAEKILPSEWKNAFSAIGKVVEALHEAIHDQHSSKFPVVVNLSLLLIYHQTLKDRLPEAIFRSDLKNPSLLFYDNALRYMKFSSAAYGAIMGMVLGVAESPLHRQNPLEPELYQDKAMICRRLQLNESDLLSVNLHHESVSEVINDLFVPRFFIAVDHSTKSIILSIRGTGSVTDLAKDLVCHSTPFLSGFAHTGMKAAAEKVYEQSLQVLQATFDRDTFRNYKLVLTGHSLGGGIAVLLALLLHHKRSENNTFLRSLAPIEVYAFAPPPVFKGPLPTELMQNIHSFVHHHDIIPRLSLGSVYQLLCELKAIDQLPISLKKRLEIISLELVGELTGKRKKVGRLKHAIHLVQEATDSPPTIRLESGDEIHFESLEMSGNIYHLHKSKTKEGKTVIYTAIHSAKDFFLPLRILSDGFLNHSPAAYEKALSMIIFSKTNMKNVNSTEVVVDAFGHISNTTQMKSFDVAQ